MYSIILGARIAAFGLSPNYGAWIAKNEDLIAGGAPGSAFRAPRERV